MNCCSRLSGQLECSKSLLNTRCAMQRKCRACRGRRGEVGELVVIRGKYQISILAIHHTAFTLLSVQVGAPEDTVTRKEGDTFFYVSPPTSRGPRLNCVHEKVAAAPFPRRVSCRNHRLRNNHLPPLQVQFRLSYSMRKIALRVTPRRIEATT